MEEEVDESEKIGRKKGGNLGRMVMVVGAGYPGQVYMKILVNYKGTMSYACFYVLKFISMSFGFVDSWRK